MTEALPTKLRNATGKLRRSAGSWVVPAAVAALSICVTVAVWLHLRHNEEESYAEDLTSEIALITVELRDRLRAQGEFLRSVRAFFEINPDISPAQWITYSQRLDIERYNSTLVSYAFVARVTPAEVDAFTEAARRRYQQPAFSITPPPLLEDAFVVTNIAPQSERALRAIGGNMYAEARRRSTIETARDTDNVSMSGRIALSGDQKESALQSSLKKPLPPAFLMMLPVYRQGQRPRTVSERRQDISGIVVAAFRMSEFMESLNYSRHGRLAMRIFDDESFNASTENTALTLLYDTFGSIESQYGQLEEREVEFGQRRWLVQFRPKEPLPVIRESSVLLGGGLAISLLLGLLTWTQTNRRQQAERYAQAMNAELKHSEERFKLSAEGSSNGLWDRDLSGDRIYVSERLEEMLGFAPGTIQNSVIFLTSRIHPDDRLQIQKAGLRHIKERTPYNFECRLLKGDQTWGVFQVCGQAVWDKNGQAVRMAGSVADISQRKAAEAQLERYKDFLSTVLKSIPLPIFVKDRKGRFLMANAAMCEFVKTDEQVLIGQQRFDNVPLPIETAQGIRHLDDALFSTGEMQIGEYELPIRGRGLCRVIARKSIAIDPDGEPIQIGTLTDVTERRQAEHTIQQTIGQLQSVLDAATEVSIVATDANGLIVTFNRGAEKMLGYDASDLIGRHSPATFHLDSEVSARCESLSAKLGRPVSGFEGLTGLARINGVERREWTYVHKDGALLTVDLVITAVLDGTGEITGFLGIAIDISERKLAEAELFRHRDHLQEMVAEQTVDLLNAKDVAERANLAKSEFLANMSHEMRTPMHAVLSFAGLGEEKATAADPGGKLALYFQRIRQSGERLLRLLNDLLDLSKLEAGKMHVEPKHLDVLPLIREAGDEFESLLNSRHLTLTIQPPECSTEAMCDAMRFGQVVRNLLSNAIKFSPDGGQITISFAPGLQQFGRRADEKSMLPTLRIIVADQGVSIPPSELESIFEKFVQSSKTKTGAGGTGLGLSICREIMRAHRGSIEACNNPAEGASFILQLPVAPLEFPHPMRREP